MRTQHLPVLGAVLFCLTTQSCRVSEPQPNVVVAPPAPVIVDEYLPPRSPWLENEKAWAADRLAKSPVEFLVLPFQTDGDSFDVIERNLLARSLAHALATRYGVKVADPSLVERALGTGARQFTDEAVATLADVVQAKTVVLGYLGHDGGATFHWRIETLIRENGAITPSNRRVSVRHDAMPLVHTAPPYVRFLELRDEILAGIMDGKPTRPVEAREAGAIPALPRSMDELTSPRGPFELAHVLQFLAGLHPSGVDSRPRERLLERSLVVLEELPQDSASRALRARAWLGLYRRPVAQTLLAEPSSAEEVALKAHMDGNLDALWSSLADIDDPMVRLIATLDGERLADIYQRPADPELADRLAEEQPFWEFQLREALAELNDWGGQSPLLIKRALDVHLPVAQFDLENVLKRAAALGDFPEEREIVELAYEHIATSRGELSDAGAAPENLAYDLLDLAEISLVANAVNAARHTRGNQGKPDWALERIRAYESLFAGHPSFTVELGLVERDLAGERGQVEADNLREASRVHLRHAALWANGQTNAAWYAVEKADEVFPAWAAFSEEERRRRLFRFDWPGRPIWVSFDRTQDAYELCLAYEVRGLYCLSNLHSELVTRDPAAAQALLDANEHRFHGDPNRTLRFAAMRSGRPVNQFVDSIFEEAIATGTVEWRPYLQIGRRLARTGKPHDAAEMYLKYPGFHGARAAVDVVLSNYAYDAGNPLYESGAYEDARPLLEFARDIGTGSQANIMSTAKLALIDGDLPTAIEETVRAARRYEDETTLRDLMLLMNAFGDGETAMSVFEQLADRHDKPELWVGPFAVHRKQRAKLDELIDWATKGKRAAVRGRFDSLALRHILMSGVIDRDLDANLPEVLVGADPGPLPLRHVGGKTTINGQWAGPAAHFPQWPTDGTPGVPTESRLPTVVRGLTALGAGDVHKAFEQLDAASRVHDLREFFPYYAWASALVGDTERIEFYLSTAVPGGVGNIDSGIRGFTFNEYLSLALLRGGAGSHDAALDFLVRANADVPDIEDRSIFPRYQVLEAAELLYEQSKDQRYRGFLVDTARRYSVTDPLQSWTHAFLGKYSADARERRQALARALFLDPLSQRAADASPADRAAAQQILDRGNPFLPAQRDELQL